MKFLCQDCNTTTDSPTEITICPCGSTNVIRLLNEVTTPIVKNPETNVGFVATPKKIYDLFKLCALPASGKNHVFDKFVLLINPKGLGVSVIQQTNDGQFYNYGYVKKTYFDEIWGEGNMPINAGETIPDVDFMRKHEKCYVNNNTKDAVIQVYAGQEHILSSRAETADAIITARFEPIKFDLEKFLPLPNNGSSFGNITFDVRCSELLSMEDLLKRKIYSAGEAVGKKVQAIYYPFFLSEDGVYLSMGDVDNPVSSSLHEKLNVIDYKKPSQPIRVIVGEIITSVLKNLPKDSIIRIHVIDSNAPVWVSSEVLDEAGKDVGKFGYIISTKSQDE